ncbi:MAG: hypothetical protein ACTMIR_02365 [Cellulomonadaceae bacterium]
MDLALYVVAVVLLAVLAAHNRGVRNVRTVTGAGAESNALSST